MDKSQFVIISIGIKLIARKMFAMQYSFTDCLRQKILNQATCRKPSANPCQLEAH